MNGVNFRARKEPMSAREYHQQEMEYQKMQAPTSARGGGERLSASGVS